jgi:hypothetical protein
MALPSDYMVMVLVVVVVYEDEQRLLSHSLLSHYSV